MKVFGIFDHSGPKLHRILLPLSQMPGVEFTCSARLQFEEQIKGVDIVFVNRLIPGISPNLSLPILRQKFGFKLIVDLDDHWRLDPSHYLFKGYKEHNVSETIESYIKLADAVIVTHERLYKEVLRVNKNVHILPNAIPRVGQFTVQKVESEFTRLFWAGGVTHRNDIEMLRPVLKKIDKINVQMVLGGYIKDNPEWKAMASAFTNDGRWRSVCIEALKVEEYYKMFSLCDIALIPLVENHFNIHKSNLKILEAANIGSPVIVSRCHPYLGFPEDLVNYVDAHNPWYRNINFMIREPDFCKDQGQQLKEYCEINYNFNKINQHRKQIFYDTIQRG